MGTEKLSAHPSPTSSFSPVSKYSLLTSVVPVCSRRCLNVVGVLRDAVGRCRMHCGSVEAVRGRDVKVLRRNKSENLKLLSGQLRAASGLSGREARACPWWEGCRGTQTVGVSGPEQFVRLLCPQPRRSPILALTICDGAGNRGMQFSFSQTISLPHRDRAPGSPPCAVGNLPLLES